MASETTTKAKGFLQSATGVALSLALLAATVWVVSKAWKKGQAQ